MASRAMFLRPRSPSRGFLLTRVYSSPRARFSSSASSRSSDVSCLRARLVRSQRPLEPRTTMRTSCLRRAKTDGVQTSSCCSLLRNSLSLRPQSPRLRVKGKSPLTLPPEKKPPAFLTLVSSSLLFSLWLPEMRTAFEGLLLQQTQALHSPTLAITTSLAPTTAKTSEHPDVGHRSVRAGSPCLRRMAEHRAVYFLRASSRAGKRPSTADLYWSSEVSSFFLRISGMISAASSARSGPPCPSNTQKTETFSVSLA